MDRLDVGNGHIELRSSPTRAKVSLGVQHGPASVSGELNAGVSWAKALPAMEGADLVRTVTCPEPFVFTDPEADAFAVAAGHVSQRPRRVAAYDLGMKRNILRRFVAYGCEVMVYPATTPAEELLRNKPDGIFFSNGPGDPAVLSYAISNARQLIKADVPTFGICLGHQILSLALGGETYKLKFGHRGANHPVKELETGKVEITSQNHGFAVNPDSLPEGVTVTHVNLYDGTVEGLRSTKQPVFCVQYHPEAAPGPHDADYLFNQFVEEMERRA
jgi:carbamoyl-phosphate synthase small subunit